MFTIFEKKLCYAAGREIQITLGSGWQGADLGALPYWAGGKIPGVLTEILMSEVNGHSIMAQ